MIKLASKSDNSLQNHQESPVLERTEYSKDTLFVTPGTGKSESYRRKNFLEKLKGWAIV